MRRGWWHCPVPRFPIGIDDGGQSLKKGSEDWDHQSRVNSLERMLKATDLTQEAKIKGKRSLVVVNSIIVPIGYKTRTRYLFHFHQYFVSAVVLYRSRRFFCFGLCGCLLCHRIKKRQEKKKHFEPVLHFVLFYVEKVPVDWALYLCLMEISQGLF